METLCRWSACAGRSNPCTAKKRRFCPARPLEQKADHDEHEGGVLRVPDTCMGTGGRQGVRLLGRVENLPGRGKEHEAAEDEQIADPVKWSQVRISPPTEDRLRKVSRVVSEPIHPWKLRRQPAREQINRQREAIHLREQRHQKRGERAE